MKLHRERQKALELKKMLNDTQDLSRRFHEIIGPWDSPLLVTHLAAVVGRLADDVMTIEGKLAMPGENVRIRRNIADALIQLLRISNAYHIDLEQAWRDLLVEAHAGLKNETLVTVMSETLCQNRERQQARGEGDAPHGN